jgi:PilZ domain
MSASLALRADESAPSWSFGAVETPQQEKTNIRRLRLLKRQRVQLAALAETAEGHVAVEIKNISQTGAGLLATAHFARNEEILLHLPGGRELRAHVRWRRLGFCGVEFDAPLAFDDPVLPGLSPRVGASDQVWTPAAPERTLTPQFPALQTIVRAHNRARRTLALPAGRLHTWLKARSIWRELRRHQRLIEAACRKQGFAWLTEPESHS